MAFSFRLDPATAAKIRRLSKQRGWSQSDVVREAIAVYGDPAPAATGSGSIMDRLRAYTGTVTSGGAQLSAGTHEKYRALLANKRRRVLRAR
jgi:predicted transcriptional regulator